MAIKEVPIGRMDYLRDVKEEITEELEKVETSLKEEQINHQELYAEVNSHVEDYKKLGLNLLSYEEYINDEYTNGKFFKAAKGAFINRKANYELTTDLFNLFKFASQQKKIHELTHKRELYNKILSLKLGDYQSILNRFYTEVHKKLILEGAGYVFEGNIGWICINRFKVKKGFGIKKALNYAATKKKKEEILANGGKVYNKEEAEWCKANGIEYKYDDHKVYLDNEYSYEIPLLHCTLPHNDRLKFEVTKYNGKELRGKTYDDILKETGGDLDKICSLHCDIKLKLNLCVKSNKMLYTKFIRNENQESVGTRAAYRKDRQ